jgi:hypothetical protein
MANDAAGLQAIGIIACGGEPRVKVGREFLLKKDLWGY